MATLKSKLVVIIVLFLGVLAAQSGDLVHIYNNIVSVYDTITTFQADFVQENYWSEMDISQISQGSIYFDTTNLTLEYSTPVGQKLLIDKEKITIFNASSHQVLISEKGDIKLRPLEIIKKYWQESEISILDETEEGLSLKISTNIGETLYLQISNYLVTNLNIVDSENNSVKYSFSEMDINNSLPDGIFIFDIPGDASVIDSRNM